MPPAWSNFWNAQSPVLEPFGLSLGKGTQHETMYCTLHRTDLSVCNLSCVSHLFTSIRDRQVTKLSIRSLSSKSRVQIGRVSLCPWLFKYDSLILLQNTKRSWPPSQSSSVHYMRPLQQCSHLELSQLLPYVMCHQLVAFSHQICHVARTETLGPHTHILLLIYPGCRDRNCNGFFANDHSLHAQGMRMSLLQIISIDHRRQE